MNQAAGAFFSRSITQRLLGVALLIGMLLSASSCTPAKPQFKSVDITGIDYAHQLSLTDDSGKPRQLSDYRGKVVIVFWGYTSCPDVCPITLAELASVMKKLGPQANQVQVLFVTFDPERDSPAVMKRYLANFNPSFVGLTGNDAQIQSAAKDFKVFYQKVDGPTADSYTIDHQAVSYVFDKSGAPRLYVVDSTKQDDWVHDLKILLDSKS
jgi:protein SCO1/2